MPALDRAFALAKGHDAAVRVAEHLDLDVARTLEIFLEIDGGIAERALGFVARGLVLALQLGFFPADAHAASAAARRRLEDHGKSDLMRDRRRVLDRLHRAFAAGDDRDTGVLRRLSCPRFI